MNENTSYILLQSITSVTDFDFNNPLEKALNALPRRRALFVMDNLSEPLMISYARQFIEEADELVIICDALKTETLGSLLPVLNQCVKRKNTRLFTIGEQKLLTPFVKMMKGEVFEGREALIGVLGK